MDETFRNKPVLTATRPELLSAGDDARLRELIHGLLAFTGRLQAIRDGFAAYLDLSGVQYTILISIAHLGRGTQGDGGTPGAVGIKAVADHLHLSGAFVTIETQRLVAAGLVEKQADPADGRRVALRISDKGRDQLRRLSPIQRQVNDRLFASLDASAFHALTEATCALVDDADRALRLLDFLRHEPAEKITPLPAKKPKQATGQPARKVAAKRPRKAGK